MPLVSTRSGCKFECLLKAYSVRGVSYMQLGMFNIIINLVTTAGCPSGPHMPSGSSVAGTTEAIAPPPTPPTCTICFWQPPIHVSSIWKRGGGGGGGGNSVYTILLPPFPKPGSTTACVWPNTEARGIALHLYL